MTPEDLFIPVALGLGLGLLALYLGRTSSDTTEEDQPAPEVPTTLYEDVTMPIKNLFGLWHPPAQYAALIAQAEQRHGIDKDILARLLYQECRYREDIISGAVRSPVGAMGIAQFMPATAADMGINPLDPVQAIEGAGRYLAQLYRRFGNWSEALAAYNWGMGNVQRKGLIAAPLETTNYYTQILRDVNSANNTQLA